MVDYFALALTHGLLALAAWRLVSRPELDRSDRDDTARGQETEAREAPAPAVKTPPHA